MKFSFSSLLAALIVMTILAWSIDYGDLAGDRAQRVAEITRWGCISFSYALALISLIKNKKVARGLFFYTLLLLGAILPSVIDSKDHSQSVIAIVRLFSFAPIALLALGVREYARPRLFAASFGAMMLLVLGSLPLLNPSDALANVQTIVGGADRTRFSGLTTHPNNLAFFATCTYAFCLAVVFSQTRTFFTSWKSWFALTIGVLSGIACFATGSRTGMACVVAFPFVLAILAFPLREHGAAFVARRASTLLVTAVLVSAPLYMTVAGSGDSGGGAGDRSYDVSNHSRFVAWRASLDSFLHSPLTGVGVGAGVDLTGASEERLSYSHNVLLTWLRNSGLFAGVLAFATILLLAHRAATAVGAASRGGPGYVMTVSGALSVFAIIGFSAVDGALQGNYIFYFLLPLLYSLISRDVRKVAVDKRGLEG